MADPTGLVSLGLGVIKKAVKHGSTVRSRKRRLKELPYAIDIATAILHNAEQSGDPATRSAYSEILGPCISEAQQFLRRVENRKRFTSTINKFGRAGDDVAESTRLIAALNEAPDRAREREERAKELRVAVTHAEQNKEILVRLNKQQSNMQSIHADVARSLHLTIIYGFFFR